VGTTFSLVILCPEDIKFVNPSRFHRYALKTLNFEGRVSLSQAAGEIVLAPHLRSSRCHFATVWRSGGTQFNVAHYPFFGGAAGLPLSYVSLFSGWGA
jgi:hypothetical protein